MKKWKITSHPYINAKIIDHISRSMEAAIKYTQGCKEEERRVNIVATLVTYVSPYVIVSHLSDNHKNKINEKG